MIASVSRGMWSSTSARCRSPRPSKWPKVTTRWAQRSSMLAWRRQRRSAARVKTVSDGSMVAPPWRAGGALREQPRDARQHVVDVEGLADDGGGQRPVGGRQHLGVGRDDEDGRGGVGVEG